MNKVAKPYSLDGKRVWVAGHGGLVGSALVKRLAAERCELISVSRNMHDLRRQIDVEEWLAEVRPEAVFLAAATVGGIHANDSRHAKEYPPGCVPDPAFYNLGDRPSHAMG